MPMTNIAQTTFDRLQTHAVPLVDSIDDVINRALDALEVAKSVTGTRTINPASPPNLAYTSIKTMFFNEVEFPPAEKYWNNLLLAVIREASHTLSTADLHKLILCNHVVGQKEDNGYKWVKEAGVSVQGQDSNNAWKSTFNILKAIKANAQIIFVWQENPKAAAPGETAMLNVEW
jgi:hypothetical protein